jgi:AcrR family transcriptional regulator
VTLLAERGIHGTSLDAVAEAVGVAKSSILWHFGSKEGLLLRVAEVVFEVVAQGRVQEILALESFEARVEATWRMFADTVREAPALRRLVLHLIFESVEGRPELRERLQHLYRAMRELFEAGLRGAVPDARRRRSASVIAVATFDGVFLQWLLDPEAVDGAARPPDVAELYARAGLIGGAR